MSLVNAASNIVIDRASGDVDDIGAQTSSTLDNVYAETIDLDMGDPFKRKFVSRVLLWLTSIDAVSNFKLILKGRNDIKDPLETIGEYTAHQVSEPLKMRTAGYNFIRLRVEDNGVVVNWALFGFEIHGVLGGRRV
jgi:hypothetical protein